ncbi:ankyrin repeat-containing protein ITN1-like [Senna tora]|uniref:Ankyrin repeat-containing protein ITN1-like n=1 Tax=Senna tora TaxID=362788 RepID=A0A834TAG9_9FABA|nr:ankyrin repeat-containing protein ITN1-like [Senna tora]
MRSICFHPKTPSFSTSTTNNNNNPTSISNSSDSSCSTRVMSFSESSIDRCIEEAQALILKWDLETSAYAQVTSLFYNDKPEAMQYIKCVTQLHKAMHLLLSYNPVSSHKLTLANHLIQKAMKRLQKEFYQILSINRAYLDPESVSTTSTSSISYSSFSDFDNVLDDIATSPDDDVPPSADSISQLELASSLAMKDLRSIADCMISCGYSKECVHVYRVIRKSIIDEGIYRLNLEKLSASHVNRMDWKVVELKIKIWLEAVKVAVRTLFNGERILCDNVFATSDLIRECCFADISRHGANLVFALPELVVSRTKKSPPDKIFRLLDMFTVLSELWPEIQSIFSFNSTSEISSQVFNSLSHLTDSVRTMLSEFESRIQKDTSKSSVKSGGVHQLTTQAMDYLSNLADYSNLLYDIFVDWTPPPKSPLPEYLTDRPDSDESSAATPFSARIAGLIFVLMCKLDSKTKHCKDASVSYLFLANNLQHVIDTVRNSDLQYVLGEEWILKHEKKLKGFLMKYEKMAWGEVFSCLPEKAAVRPEETKVIFSSFNFRFEEAYRKQNCLTVAHRKLRDEIKGSIAGKIVGRYRELYNAHKMMVGSVRDMTMYVTFTPDDVENYLENLFSAGGDAGSVTTSSSSVDREGALPPTLWLWVMVVMVMDPERGPTRAPFPFPLNPPSEPTTPTTPPPPTLFLSSSAKALHVSNSSNSLASYSNSNSGKRYDKKKYVKQVTGRHHDTELHLAAQRGDVIVIRHILGEIDAQMVGTAGGADFDAELEQIRSAIVNEVNELGETPLFVAAERGHIDVVNELLPFASNEGLSFKNRSGYTPLHVAASQGHQAIVQVLLNHDPELIHTFGQSNATPLISAATKGHAEVVDLLLERDPSMLELSRSNGKNALHFAARQGHARIVKSLLRKDPQLTRRVDKKGQTALHMAVKGVSCEVVKLLLDTDPATVMLPDKFNNTALHIATRKKRAEILNELLLLPDINVNALTRDHKTSLDIAEGLPPSEEMLEIRDCLLRNGAVKANDLNQPKDELRKTVTEIRKDVQIQLEQSRKTNKNVNGIAKELRRLHREGINNATNSVTVVASLFATVAFAAIFTVPGGDDDHGMALMVQTKSFKIFFISNSIALFTSLAVVLVQITVVRGHLKTERRVVEVINKLMWLASVCTTVAYISSAYIVIGRRNKWAATLVTVIGGLIMAGVLGAMTFYVVKSNHMRRVRKREKLSKRHSWHHHSDSDSEVTYSEKQLWRFQVLTKQNDGF